MEWKKLFDVYALREGLCLYLDENVSLLSCSDSQISARIDGPEECRVEISMKDGKIEEMSCDCSMGAFGRIMGPFGSSCRHQAAVLYACENRDRKDSSRDEVSPLSIQELLAGAGEEEIRQLLLEVMETDPSLALRFRLRFCPELSRAEMLELKKQISLIITRYKGGMSLCDPKGVSFFIAEINREVTAALKLLTKRGFYEEAFDYSAFVFVRIPAALSNTFIKEQTDFAESILPWWEEILSEAERRNDLPLQKKMFDWLASDRGYELDAPLEGCAEDFWKNHFNRGGCTGAKLALIDEKIACYENLSEDSVRSLYLPRWILTRLDTMKELGSPWEEVSSLAVKYTDFDEIRSWYVKACQERGFYDEAIRLLKERLPADGSDEGWQPEIFYQLRDLYLAAGNRQEAVRLLIKIFIKVSPGDLSVLEELRSYFSPKDWPEVREKLFSILPSYVRLPSLYLAEEMYGPLLDLVMKSGDFSLMEEYREVLLPRYPKEYLDACLELARKEVRSVGSRSRYQKLADLLLKISRMPEGEEAARELEQSWRRDYQSRPALMDELNKMHQQSGWELPGQKKKAKKSKGK